MMDTSLLLDEYQKGVVDGCAHGLFVAPAFVAGQSQASLTIHLPAATKWASVLNTMQRHACRLPFALALLHLI